MGYKWPVVWHLDNALKNVWAGVVTWQQDEGERCQPPQPLISHAPGIPEVKVLLEK